MRVGGWAAVSLGPVSVLEAAADGPCGPLLAGPGPSHSAESGLVIGFGDADGKLGLNVLNNPPIPLRDAGGISSLLKTGCSGSQCRRLETCRLAIQQHVVHFKGLCSS